MGFFKKTKGLPALEKRLLDAVQKQENLKNAKEKLLGDLLQGQDAGSNTDAVEAQLAKVRVDIELVEKEIELLKGDIREYCRLEAEKEVSALPERKTRFEETRQKLIDEANEKLARCQQVYGALGSEQTPAGLPVSAPKSPSALDQDVADFLSERSILNRLGTPSAAHDRAVDLLAESEGRVGVRLRGAA